METRRFGTTSPFEAVAIHSPRLRGRAHEIVCTRLPLRCATPAGHAP
jgi:hypothetical protein